MKKILFVATMLAMVLSLSAQRQMYVWQDGVKTTYEVANVDSITFFNPDPNTGATGSENGYEYVDLGLSVKWATCNVGASKPEEYGDYFAWGETQPKDYYDWRTYKYCNGSAYSLTKYCTDSYYGSGIIDNRTTLDWMLDDAAHANWGGSWRMPTIEEQQELIDNCTWTWTTQNGVYGYKVTSKKSGYTNKSIFLPAAGGRYLSSLVYAGSSGVYWSSSLYTDDPGSACLLSFRSDCVYGYGHGGGRVWGNSVRPVCRQKILFPKISRILGALKEKAMNTFGGYCGAGRNICPHCFYPFGKGSVSLRKTES